MSEKEKELLVSEVNILKNLKSSFIVRYYDRIIDKKSRKIYIIMEYCGAGDLSNEIKKKKADNDNFSESFIWKVIAQLCLALYECHDNKPNKILHRDIKPQNIFLASPTHVKLGDFGLAKSLSESKYATTNVGTPYYQSPEQVKEQAYNEKSDMWSLGCVIYELCNQHPPFQAKNHLGLALKIKAGQYPPVKATYSSDLRNLIANCLKLDPVTRFSVEDLMQCPEVALRIKEIKMNEKFSHQMLLLKQKEDELAEKEKKLEERERDVERKEKELSDEKEEFKFLVRTSQKASPPVTPPTISGSFMMKKASVSEEDKENANPGIYKKFKIFK